MNSFLFEGVFYEVVDVPFCPPDKRYPPELVAWGEIREAAIRMVQCSHPPLLELLRAHEELYFFDIWGPTLYGWIVYKVIPHRQFAGCMECQGFFPEQVAWHSTLTLKFLRRCQ